MNKKQKKIFLVISTVLVLGIMIVIIDGISGNAIFNNQENRCDINIRDYDIKSKSRGHYCDYLSWETMLENPKVEYGEYFINFTNADVRQVDFSVCRRAGGVFIGPTKGSVFVGETYRQARTFKHASLSVPVPMIIYHYRQGDESSRYIKICPPG